MERQQTEPQDITNCCFFFCWLVVCKHSPTLSISEAILQISPAVALPTRSLVFIESQTELFLTPRVGRLLPVGNWKVRCLNSMFTQRQAEPDCMQINVALFSIKNDLVVLHNLTFQCSWTAHPSCQAPADSTFSLSDCVDFGSHV